MHNSSGAAWRNGYCQPWRKERMMEAIANPNATVAPIRPDRRTAYHQTRQILLCNPTNAAAWLQMSSLVDDPQQQRECFERVLALDPHNPSAHEGLERVRLKALLATLATSAQQPIFVPKKLGEYLVAEGLISELQLERALREQRRRKAQGLHTPLGEILINAGWLTPQTLAYALVSQLPQQQRGMYLRLGEYLVCEGIITCRQLEAALAEQLALKQQGEHVQLGELLLRRNVLTRAQLERLLSQQRREFFSCFGD
jgi:hypothetical protein